MRESNWRWSWEKKAGLELPDRIRVLISGTRICQISRMFPAGGAASCAGLGEWMRGRRDLKHDTLVQIKVRVPTMYKEPGL